MMGENEDREFQLEMLKIQMVLNFIMTDKYQLIAIEFSFLTARACGMKYSIEVAHAAGYISTNVDNKFVI